MTHAFSGAGPGIQTPDGCSVELYRQLPYMNELADIEIELKARGAALELGCGTGRLCRRLQELGLQVAGVDESAAMLAQLPTGVEGIQCRIEELNLGRRWPVVLLASHLINHPEESVRRSFVTAAARHIEPKGTFYIKRHSTQWLATVQDGPIGESNGIRYSAENVRRHSSLLSMTLHYEAFGQVWSQAFTTCSLEKQEIERLLVPHGFVSVRWLGSNQLWGAADASDA